jgi:hypothetical protein
VSYTDYSRSMIRTGYRPYGATNPQAAAAGLAGVSMPKGPFGPWRLSGMGQHQPFTPAGAFKLHGLAGVTASFLGALGDMVPDQSIVTYTGTWVPHGTQGATDVIGQVSGILSGEGLAVRSVSSSAYRFLLNNTFNVKLTIQVQNGEGYGQPSDIASIVDNAAWQVTGSMPLASSISSVQVPGGAAPSSTGQPEIPNTGAGAGALLSQPTDLTTWLEQNAVWLAVGAALIGIPLLLKR